MFRSAICIGVFIGMGTGVPSPNGTPSEPAKIKLTLPPNIPSESVQISYFMVGAFGGFGDVVRPVKGKAAYDIPAALDGSSAANVKLIAYMPGCEIVTLSIPISQAALSYTLTCRLLPRTLLRGVISPASTLREHERAEVEINYLAMWDHHLFGICDGMVTAINVARAVPNGRGQFEVSVPDFGSQTDLGKAEFQLILRDSATDNIIAFLRPTTDVADSIGVPVRRDYPSIIEFRVDAPLESDPK